MLAIVPTKRVLSPGLLSLWLVFGVCRSAYKQNVGNVFFIEGWGFCLFPFKQTYCETYKSTSIFVQGLRRAF